jgi:hypothetical protein
MFPRRLPICHHRPSVQHHLRSLKDYRRRPPRMPETCIRDLRHLNSFTHDFASASVEACAAERSIPRRAMPSRHLTAAAIRRLRVLTTWACNIALSRRYSAFRRSHSSRAGRWERISISLGRVVSDMVECICVHCGSARTSANNLVFLKRIPSGTCSRSPMARRVVRPPTLRGLKDFSHVYSGWFCQSSRQQV